MGVHHAYQTHVKEPQVATMNLESPTTGCFMVNSWYYVQVR